MPLIQSNYLEITVFTLVSLSSEKSSIRYELHSNDAVSTVESYESRRTPAFVKNGT